MPENKATGQPPAAAAPSEAAAPIRSEKASRSCRSKVPTTVAPARGRRSEVFWLERTDPAKGAQVEGPTAAELARDYRSVVFWSKKMEQTKEGWVVGLATAKLARDCRPMAFWIAAAATLGFSDRRYRLRQLGWQRRREFLSAMVATEDLGFLTLVVVGCRQ